MTKPRVRPTVSVVITSYNHSKYIGEAIDSVLSQTHPVNEIIVVDDFSNDDTLEVLQSYAGAIRLISNESNLGGAVSSSIGVAVAQSEYVAILNSDDRWHPKKIQLQLAFMEENCLDACFALASIIDENGHSLDHQETGHEVFAKSAPYADSFLVHFFYFGNFLCHSSVLARTETFRRSGPYVRTLTQLPDFEKWISFAKLGEIGVLPEFLVDYRFLGDHNASNSASDEVKTRTLFEHFMIFLDFFEGVSKPTIRRLFRDHLPMNSSPTSKLELVAHLLLSHPSETLRPVSELAGMTLLYRKSISTTTDRLLRTASGVADSFHAVTKRSKHQSRLLRYLRPPKW
jgi:glycosyltransferase involved in cell wall biosynthesis